MPLRSRGTGKENSLGVGRARIAINLPNAVVGGNCCPVRLRLDWLTNFRYALRDATEVLVLGR